MFRIKNVLPNFLELAVAHLWSTVLKNFEKIKTWLFRPRTLHFTNPRPPPIFTGIILCRFYFIFLSNKSKTFKSFFSYTMLFFISWYDSSFLFYELHPSGLLNKIFFNLSLDFKRRVRLFGTVLICKNKVFSMEPYVFGNKYFNPVEFKLWKYKYLLW